MCWKKIWTPLTLPAMLLLCGCEPPVVEPLPPLKKETSANAEPSKEPEWIETATQTWVSEEQLPSEIWYVQYINGQRAGYFKTQVSKPDRMVRINQSGRYILKMDTADPDLTHYSVEMESLEFPDGKVASFNERTRLGDQTTEIAGKLSGNLMKVTIKEDDAKPKSYRVKWKEGTWGMLGIQSMLLSNPMQPGEQRTCNIFVPKLNPPQIVPTRLIAGQPTITTVAGGKTRELIPIETSMTAGENINLSTNFVDSKGVIYKTVGGSVSTYFAPKEIAMTIADEMELSSKLNRTALFYGIAPAPDAKTATYLVKGEKLDLFAMWNKRVRQKVKSASALSAEVTILDVNDPSQLSEIEPDPPTAEHLASSPLINSEHNFIAEQAQQLFGDAIDAENLDEAKASDLQERILKLAASIDADIESLDPSATLASALSTARRQKGNDNAKAFLMTALLRNRGVPTRIATGMKLDPDVSRMRFHMWVECWTGERWLPIDPSTGKVVGVYCLKMLDSSFTEQNPYTTILPVYKAMDLIEVQVFDN